MTSPIPWRRAVPDAFLALALGALGWAVYHRALGLWLTYDDFFHLHYLYTYSPRQYLFDPEIWQRLPFKMITPLLFLSFDLDLALFGLDARAFLIHQLASFAVCVAALYLVLRLWLERVWAALAAAIFLLGPVVTGIAPLLMVRHYIETTTLGLAAAGLYVLAIRRGGRGGVILPWISAALYFAAMLAKEIAVPLAFLLPLLPEGTVRERLRRAVPHGMALVFYLVYRVWMLGTLTGGYGWIVDPSDLPRLALMLPYKTAVDLLGVPSAANWALLVCLLLGVLVAALQGRRAALLAGVAILLALLPILPVSADMKPRYALPAWLVLVIGFPLGARALARRPGAVRLTGAGLAAIAVVGAVFCHLQEREIAFARLERMSAENRAFLRLGPGDLLRQPVSPPATMGELAWMKTDVLGGKPGTGWFYDDFYLCERPQGPGQPRARVWGYDPVARRVEDMTGQVPALRRRYCSSIRRDAPLSLEIHAAGPRALYWHLGPYREGRYAFVFGDGVQAFEMPATGGFQLKQVGRLSLRVRYESPEGWITYSPELDLDFTRQPSYRWARSPRG